MWYFLLMGEGSWFLLLLGCFYWSCQDGGSVHNRASPQCKEWRCLRGKWLRNRGIPLDCEFCHEIQILNGGKRRVRWEMGRNMAQFHEDLRLLRTPLSALPSPQNPKKWPCWELLVSPQGSNLAPGDFRGIKMGRGWSWLRKKKGMTSQEFSHISQKNTIQI